MNAQQVPSGGLGSNQYDFISNPNKPKKRGNLLGGLGGNNTQRYLILFIGAVLVLILVFGLLTLIFGGGGGNREQLIDLAKSQNSIIELTNSGQKNSRSSDIVNISTSLDVALITDRNSTLERIDGEVKPEVIKADLGDLGTSLEEAVTNGTFDETYLTALTQSLTDYQSRLQNLFDTTESQSTKEVLQTTNLNVEIILDLLNQV